MGFKHYGVNTGGLPVEYIKHFTEKYSIPVFIETGTAGGDSVRAAAPLFKECHTIEIVGGRAAGKFPANITLHNGSSANLLGNIAKKYPYENIFFWLDAHWSEPHESEAHVDECPILAEIEAIGHCGKRALIMIDDARLFYGRPPWPCNPSKWPRFQFVFEALRRNFPDNVVSIVDDYIVCFPLVMDEAHKTEWYHNYTKRFPSDESKLKDSTKLAFDSFLNYIK